MLEELPFEMCALTSLAEFHAADNQLQGLPLEFGYLTSLEKLHLQKNKIKEMPEVFTQSTTSICLLSKAEK